MNSNFVVKYVSKFAKYILKNTFSSFYNAHGEKNVKFNDMLSQSLYTLDYKYLFNPIFFHKFLNAMPRQVIQN